MLIPYDTDAPIYHRPFGTFAMITLQLAVVVHSIRDPFFVTEKLSLSIGNGLHIAQWFTYSFGHTYIAFALANMVFLGVFGTIVEGKIGWWRFLLLYFAIAVVTGAIIQASTLAIESSAIRGSAAVFGVMIVACLWAPLNEISFVWVLYYRGYYFEATALATGFMYLVGNVAALAAVIAIRRNSTPIFNDDAFSSGDGLFLQIQLAASLLAGAIGLASGILMLKRGWVDCEGFDALTIAHSSREGTDPRSSEEEQAKELKATEHAVKHFSRCVSAPEGRQTLAWGVSPRILFQRIRKAPEGRQMVVWPRTGPFLSPLWGCCSFRDLVSWG